MSERHDPALDRLIAECAAQLALEIEAEAPALCPDFVAVLEEAAARGLIPHPPDLRVGSTTDPLALRRESSLASPPSDPLALRHESSLASPPSAPLALAPPLAPDDPLADLVHEAQRAAAADTAARALLALPPAPAPRARPPAWLGTLLAVAAVYLLVIGLRPLLAQPKLHSGAPNQAEWRDLERPAESPVPGTGPALAQPTRRSAPTQLPGAIPGAIPSAAPGAIPGAAPGAIPGAIPDAAPSAPPPAERDDTPDPSSSEATTAEATTAEPAPQLDPIAALERAAEARWSAGDLHGAEPHLREIIRRSRSARQRDLAYGDLFTITRQLRGRDAEAALWSEYLDRLPRGRYADDARAGLCRRDDDPPLCWREYLKKHPRGAHRGEAERAAALPSP